MVLNTLIGSLFAFGATSSLVAHFYNSITIGNMKLFHVLILVTLSFSLSLFRRIDLFDLLCFIFSFMTLISGFLSDMPEDLGCSVNVAVLVMGLNRIRYVEKSKFSLWAIYGLLLICVSSILLWCKFPTGRFYGWYNDPNYLVMTLVVLLYVNMKSFQGRQNKVLSVLIISNIFLAFLVVFFTMSRTGMCALLALTLGWTIGWGKKYFFRLSILSIVGVLILGGVISAHFPAHVDMFRSRLDGSRYSSGDDITSAYNTRFKLSASGVEYYLKHPRVWLFGTGTGSSDNFNDDSSFVAIGELMSNRDHNTFTSVLTEQGILAFVAYCFLLFLVFKKCTKNSFFNIDSICFFVMLLFSCSIWTITYLPWWFLIFYLLAQDFDKNIQSKNIALEKSL